MSNNGKQAIVIRNGTLIDSNGGPPVDNDAIVVEGNRITSVGAVPGGMNLEDTDKVRVIDASGQWIMPGLIDGHCHLSFGQPAMPGLSIAKGSTSPEFNTIRAAINAQKVLRAGVTSLSIPGGTWFTDVALREDDVPRAVKAERNQILLALQEGVSLTRHRALVGGVAEILVEERGRYEGQWFGRTRGNQGVIVEDPRELLGARVRVRVNRGPTRTLFGKIEAGE